ncbi:MAG TPA: oligosaccharide repeat unit polymerase [Methanothermococcus okinawensis]|uniref:Oligosaccharide repeat unit polymerase n=1 Tax=Methanothermococcus okinawensis TaxID=155863 RepID=A0A832ZAG1_9EURY|nr:oligosaccharide repeat unit polymerase [Methanothermococcus okinawensis]
MEYIRSTCRRLEGHHLFLILTSLFIVLTGVSYYTGTLVLLSALIFYISFVVGKRLYYILGLDEGDREIYKREYTFGLLLMNIGLLFLILDILWAGGIPLFDPTSKRFLSPLYTMLSRLLILGWAIVIASNLSLDKVRVVLYSLIFAAVVMLLGYRTGVVVLLTSTLFVLYYSNRIKNRELILFVLGIFLLLLLLSLIRLKVVGSEGIPLLSRMDLTMSVLDIIVHNFNGVFNGYLLYCAIYSYLGMAPGPRTVIANSLGIQGVTITPTIFGGVIGDFGILGVIPYFAILGISMGLLYKIAENSKGIYLGVYAVILSYLLVSIETAILDLDVIMYFILGFLLCIYAIVKKYRSC